MANGMVRNRLGIVDKRTGRTQSTAQYSGTTATNAKDIAAMRARLTAISASTYTSAVLDAMTANDMQYAIILADEAASI